MGPSELVSAANSSDVQQLLGHKHSSGNSAHIDLQQHISMSPVLAAFHAYEVAAAPEHGLA